MTILAGAKVDAADLGALGAAWTAYTPTLTNVSGGTATFASVLVGKTLFLRGQFTAGTATAAGIITVTLPSGLAVPVSQALACVQSRTVRTAIVVSATGLIELSNSDGSNFAAAASLVALRWTGAIEVS